MSTSSDTPETVTGYTAYSVSWNLTQRCNLEREWNEHVVRRATNRRCFAHRMNSWERGRAVNDERELEAPWEDPIVAEVRAARAALLAAASYDLEKLVERLRHEQVRSGRQVVSLPPRRAPRSHRDSLTLDVRRDQVLACAEHFPLGA